MAVAVWVMKGIFYGLDPNDAGFVRVDDMMGALAQAEWPRDVSAPAAPVVRQNIATAGLVTAATRDEEAVADGGATMLLHVLTGLGVGVASSPGTVNEKSGGCKGNSNGSGIGEDARADVMNYILRILDPRVSLDAIN